MYLHQFKTVVLLIKVDNEGESITPTFELC
jgi:hypothetical protein